MSECSICGKSIGYNSWRDKHDNVICMKCFETINIKKER